MKDSHIMKPNQFSRLSHFTTLALVTALAACGGGGSSSPGPASLTLTVERIDGPGLSAIQGTLHIARTGAPVLGASLTVAASSGTLSATQDLGAGDYRFLVTPDRTGEYRLDITFEGQVLTRTALVLGEVDGAWGQPMAVEGLVNTPGYEDGVTITPDGEYLFVQYGPWRFSAVELFKTSRAAGGAGGDRLVPSTFNHPWIDTTIGPTGAPERPGLFDGRFSGTALLHNSNLWGIPIDGTSNFAAITMFYGFKRQPDGSYREPFYLAFEDENDAIMNPFGLSFRMDGGDQATVLFSLDDPSDPVLVDTNSNGTFDVDPRFDVFHCPITLGQNNTLGTYEVGSPPTPGPFYPASLVEFGRTGQQGIFGTQGNPHLYLLPSGDVGSIWTDDEYDGGDLDPDNDADVGDIAVQVLTAGSLSAGSWTQVALPANVNGGGHQTMPFFTGSGLYYFEDSSVHHSNYLGTDQAADYADPGNWEPSTLILGNDPGPGAVFGTMLAVAEPTLASIDGQDVLFFVYVIVRGTDATSNLPDLDMQAGYVVRR
ncbi:MAG: hypothetical protein ACI9X4_002552 [Glaciecola sp.]|jgi:hypothetical protein